MGGKQDNTPMASTRQRVQGGYSALDVPQHPTLESNVPFGSHGDTGGDRMHGISANKGFI